MENDSYNANNMKNLPSLASLDFVAEMDPVADQQKLDAVREARHRIPAMVEEVDTLIKASRAFDAMRMAPNNETAPALIVAAIRETFEETGLMLGRKNIGTPPLIPNTTWEHFSTFGIFPCLDCLHFIARAVTPPEYPKRFDTRFFLADVMEVGHSIDFLTTPNTEFTDLIWVPLQQAKTLDIPSITEKIIEEAEIRIASKLSPFLSVPFFYKKRNSFVRELL